MSSLVRHRFWYSLGLCCLVAAVILALMPAEKTLGSVIKLVYLHGALSRAGMVGIVLAGLAGLLYLLHPRPVSARWTAALAISGLGFWIVHFLVSMPATRLTWGPWIAWGEPRVTMTLQVIAAGIVVIAVSRLMDSARFTAAANLLLGIAVAVLVGLTGVLRHPLDPIGESPSTVLQMVYLLLLIPIISAMLLIAWRTTQAGFLQDDSELARAKQA